MLGLCPHGRLGFRNRVRMDVMRRRRLLAVLGNGMLGTVLLGCSGRRSFVLADEVRPATLEQLLSLTPQELLRVDIARMNLLCAQAAYGRSIDVDAFCGQIDQWARRVKQEEVRYRKSFKRNPGRYDGSLAKFQAVNLALTLKEVFHCRYEMGLAESGAMKDLSSPAFFRNPDNVFVSGLLAKRRGTCSSIPVLMAAIGRRLGYPIKLKSTWGHLFCCWDDGVEHFNLDTNCNGVDTPSDDYYHRLIPPGPNRRPEAERWMIPSTPEDDLGVFLEIAGASLEANGRQDEARFCYRMALKYRPTSVNLRLLSARSFVTEGKGWAR